MWKRVQDDLQVSIPKTQFRVFVKPAELLTNIDTQNETQQSQPLFVEVGVKSAYHAAMLSQHYIQTFQDAFQRVTKLQVQVQFVTKAQDSKEIPEADQSTLFSDNLSVPAQKFDQHTSTGSAMAHTHQQSPSAMAAVRAGLREDYSFETFAVSSSNEMAYAAAIAVSQSPGKAYNPLFLYGGVGVGKTHLMQAVAINILRQSPDTPLTYITGEEFTNSIVAAIQEKKTIQLKNKLRRYRVLLVDDIQFIAGKESVQEEFFHTFNAIAPSGGQIILTSDRPPQEITPLEDRLRSRFEAGLIIDIQQPTFELRAAITLIKAKRIGLPLDMPLAQHIATVVDNARKIEGILAKLHSEHFLFKKPLTEELVLQILSQTEISQGMEEKQNTTLKPQDILRVVASRFQTTVKQLKGSSRVKTIVLPRHLAMFLLYERSGLTLEEIGTQFGGRDHTSILHAVEKIRGLQNEPEIHSHLSHIQSTAVDNM